MCAFNVPPQNTLAKVSDPTNPEYGKYLTTYQIGAMVAPSAERIERIYNWLSTVGVARSAATLSLHKDMMTVSLTVAQAEELLKAEFYTFKSQVSSKLVARAAAYHVPIALENDIDFVGGVIRFPQPKDRNIASVIQRAQTEETFATMDADLRMASAVARANAAAQVSSQSSSQSGSSQSGSSQAAPSGTAPIITYTHIGDREFTLFFLPLCGGSKFPATSFSAGGSGLNCGSFSHALNIARLSPEKVNSFSEFSANFLLSNATAWRDVYCGTADKFAKYPTAKLAMNGVLNKNNFPSSAIFCSIHHKVENFETLNLELTISGGAGNAVTGVAKVPSMTPAPYVTPHSLKAFYQLDQSITNTQSNNSQSVSEFLGQYYSAKDLSSFFSLMGMKDYPVAKVLGPNDQSNPGGEASLDIQVILGISNNVTTWFWSYGELHDGQEPFLQWLTEMSDMATVPWVHSTSYADEESSLSKSYMDRVNVELAKQGVRGITLLFSSGDDGLGGYTMRTNPQACAQRGAMPEFPASSPYVTSVGGTQFSNRYLPICDSAFPVDGFTYPCDGVGEIVSSSATGSRITSGGGFSVNYPRQPWQTNAVNAYFEFANANGLLANMPTYNANGRAFPDIAGVAHNYIVIINGSIVPVDGTSASTPLLASILALANDARISNNQPTIGFVTPALYLIHSQNPDAYNDVVLGNNACSAYADKCCANGFSAAPGWDPVTGLGTPIANKLLMYLGYLAVPTSK